MSPWKREQDDDAGTVNVKLFVYTPRRAKRRSCSRDAELRFIERKHVSSFQNSIAVPVIAIKTFTGNKQVGGLYQST